jgi:hypothetical protein
MKALCNVKWLCLLTALAGFSLLSGCGGGDDHADDDHGDADHADHADHADEGHADHADHADEGHADHADDAAAHPEHGPNDGHIVVFGMGESHAEWIHEEEPVEKIIVIMLDAKKKETAIPADAKVTITTTLVGQPDQTFSLSASNAADGKASRFESAASDANIGPAIDVSGGAGKILLKVEEGGKTSEARLVPHKH